MVANDSTNQELARRLDQAWTQISARIGRDEYTEYQRGVDRRYEEVEHDIGELRREMEVSVAELKRLIERVVDKGQWRITTMISVLAIVVAALVTIWLKKG